MEIGFDLISDLHLAPDDSFNWEGKATSLYCIVAGNVSSDIRTVWQTLVHLSKLYQGVFYIPGTTEYENTVSFEETTHAIQKICSRIPNLALLYHHVVIIDGVAVLGANGWARKDSDDINIEGARIEDVSYLRKSVEKLQKHLDVKKILIVTNAVPRQELYFGEAPEQIKNDIIPLSMCLESDTEMKITKWVFGTYEKNVDTTIDSINYVNNPYYKVRPYWAKRVTVEI